MKTISLTALLLIAGNAYADIPKDIVDVHSIDKSITVDARYAGKNNFVGARVDGYLAGKCFIHKDAAKALKKVQAALKPHGFGLKIFDCFRPQRAVDHFVRWAKDKDTSTKAEYYPNVDKSKLFEQGYIAEKSGHSRGATLDLTLLKLSDDSELDMGSPFDYFDPVSHTLTDKVTKRQMQNRLLLKKAMENQGFKNYSQEWWHYTYKPEPYPKSYFDGDIK